MNDKLIKYINDHHINVEKLAIKTGIPLKSMNDILNNVRKPTQKELGRIASKLVVTLDVISENEDILQAEKDNEVYIKKEKKPVIGIRFSLIIIFIIIIALVLLFITLTFNRNVRIECSYDDNYYKEEIQYNTVTRVIRLHRVMNKDGNEYNNTFYDIHLKEVKKKYKDNCTIERRQGIKLWKLN